MTLIQTLTQTPTLIQTVIILIIYWNNSTSRFATSRTICTTLKIAFMQIPPSLSSSLPCYPRRRNTINSERYKQTNAQLQIQRSVRKKPLDHVA